MRNHNSQNIGIYTETLVRIYQDLVSAILPRNEIDRDIEEIRTRSSNERMGFLTKLLPALGKSIDVSLASGTPLNVLTLGFQIKRDTNLPRFMYGLLSRVFRDDGVPWFATWYTDFQHWPQGRIDGPRPDLAEVDADVSARWDKIEQTRQFGDWLQSQLFDAMFRKQRPRVPSKGYPGQAFLREVLGDSIVFRAINVGICDVNIPLDSDVELNLRREAMVVALKSIRQVCYAFYKLDLPYTDEQKTKTLADFVAVDAGLDFNFESLRSTGQAIHKEARRIIRRVLANADPRSGIPRHGPGAVATGEKSHEKHLFKRDYQRLTAVFGLDEWFFCNSSHVCDSFKELQALKTLGAGTAKVVLVPKDSRGPRLISCEPLEIQWIQQSLMCVLVDTIEKHWLTGGRVNFTRQDINRDLALKASRDFTWTTLDMKEASDRVSATLVQSLVPDRWWEHLYASRSADTQLPDGRIVNLKKFAPMGSAVCFPVEALIFWAISVATIIIHENLPLREAATKVYVYGDDIICDAKYHGVISSALPLFGLMLNEGKCCTAGPFKESCGMDAFYGMPVTPTKISCVWCEHPEPGFLASYVEYSNAFYRSGMFETAFYLETEIQNVLRRRRMSAIPTVSSGEPSCLAFVRQHERPIPKNRALGCKIRFARNGVKNFQRLEVRGYRLETTSRMTKSYGWPFLLRKLTEMEAKSRFGQLDRYDACSLLTGQYPIAHRVKLTRAWTPLT